MDSQDLHLTVNINSDTKYPRVLGDFVHGVLHQCMGVVYMECYTSVWGLCTWSATPVYGGCVHGVLHQCMGVVYMECYTSVCTVLGGCGLH